MRPDMSEVMKVRYDASLILTPGTIDRGDAIVHPSLGVEVHRASERFTEDLLELGLASEAPKGGTLRWLLGAARSSARALH
jgi:hypothetical protein